MAGFHHLFVVLSVIFIPGSCEVSLNSSLVDGTVFLGDKVNFTCRTVGSITLAWSSQEFIGQNGQLSVSPSANRSSINGHAVATVTNTYIENGRRVLESTLTIIVQVNILNASVTCSSVGTGESNMTSFSLANNPKVECEDLMVCPKNVRNFTCETRGSTSLSWESAEYIGGIPLSFTLRSQLGDKVNSHINPMVSASLMMNYETNGVRVLMSQLIVIVSEDILDDMHHMITCVNVGLGVSDNRTLHMAQDGSCASQSSTESETTQSEGVISPSSSVNSTSEKLNQRNIIIGVTCALLAVLGVPAVVVTLLLLCARPRLPVGTYEDGTASINKRRNEPKKNGLEDNESGSSEGNNSTHQGSSSQALDDSSSTERG